MAAVNTIINLLLLNEDTSVTPLLDEFSTNTYNFSNSFDIEFAQGGGQEIDVCFVIEACG